MCILIVPQARLDRNNNILQQWRFKEMYYIRHFIKFQFQFQFHVHVHVYVHVRVHVHVHIHVHVHVHVKNFDIIIRFVYFIIIDLTL